MIYNHFPSWFRKRLDDSGQWPTSYCCVDVETTGFQVDRDVVTEWGHVLVVDGEVTDRLTLVIDWSDRDVPPDWWLRQRIEQVRQSMSMAGAACHTSYARMKSEGVKPEKAFGFIADFVKRIQAAGMPFVLHGGTFDEKMLAANYIGFSLADGFTFGDRLFDTAGIEKASQIPTNSRMHPREGDTPRDYFTRVQHTKINGLKSNLDDHCFAKYGFGTKYGIRKYDLHAAEMDAYCCHLLMAEFGAMVTDPVTPPVFPTADSAAARRGVTIPTVPAGPVAAQSPAAQVPVVPLRRTRGQRNS